MRRRSCSMFEDQQTCFSMLINKLNCFIASIGANLWFEPPDAGNHMCQMARLNRIVSAQHDLNAGCINTPFLEADAQQRKTLFL